MSKINVSDWKKFKVGDLINFDSSAKIYHAEHLDILDKPEDLTYYPYVVRTAFNNGIKGYIKEDPNTLNPANTISFAQDTAQLFYQDTPYFTGNKIKICTIKDHDLTKNIALFLISVLLNGFDTFSYDSSFNVATLSRVNIKLPVTSTGEPDWDYMDEYIEKLATQAHKNVSSLATLKPVEHKIDIKAWKEFKIGELFDQIKTKKIPFKALDLPSKPDGINTLPLVAAGVDNQGRNRYVDPKYADALSNCLTVSANGANSGVTFYQNSDFSILQDAYALELNENYKDYRKAKIYLFLAGILNRALINNDWTNKATWARVQKKNILFPVTSIGQPDFDYMEKYIDSVQNKAHESLELLKQI